MENSQSLFTNHGELSPRARDILNHLPEILSPAPSPVPSHRENRPVQSVEPVVVPRPLMSPSPQQQQSQQQQQQQQQQQLLQHHPASAQLVSTTPVTFIAAHLETRITIVSPTLWQFIIFGRIDYLAGARYVYIDVLISRFVRL